MDRRTLLALLLTAIVIVATPFIFPAPRRVMDTTVAMDSALPTAPTQAQVTQAPATVAPAPAAVAPAPIAVPVAPIDTVTVATNRATYHFEGPGATPSSVTLRDYRSLRRGGSGPVELVPAGDRLFRLHVVRGTDTLPLDATRFRAEPQRREGDVIVQSFASVGGGLAAPVTVTYRFPVDSFAMHVEGTVGGTAAPGRLFVTLPTRISSEEADVSEDTRQLAMGYKRGNDEPQSLRFDDLDSLEARVDTGAIRWVIERNKYFAIALIPASDSAFRAVSFRGGSRADGLAVAASGTAVLPFDGQHFALRVYAGPQSWQALKATAPDLENLNPYGGWIHGMVQPFTTIVMRALLWMRHTFDVGYGWVLVIFGVLVRLLLWPLNQNAMRSSIKMQRIQPQLMELQKKHADNPERQREAMLKLYQEHGMSPFTPVLGCLPMLLPMPILFALYFVFQNTIELRGVSFLWLPDLSLRDPFFITPIFMGVSMFVLSWIGMRGVPPSPQAKMMTYMMPVVFTVIFWNFASGLNLYYAVQNVAALPQQWLLANERVKAKPKPAG